MILGTHFSATAAWPFWRANVVREKYLGLAEARRARESVTRTGYIVSGCSVVTALVRTRTGEKGEDTRS